MSDIDPDGEEFLALMRKHIKTPKDAEVMIGCVMASGDARAISKIPELIEAFENCFGFSPKLPTRN